MQSSTFQKASQTLYKHFISKARSLPPTIKGTPRQLGSIDQAPKPQALFGSSNPVRSNPVRSYSVFKEGFNLVYSDVPDLPQRLFTTDTCTKQNNTTGFDKTKIESIINLPRNKFQPESLFTALESLPSPYGGTLKEELNSSVGVWEGYTLQEHTSMVLHQFERYFSDDAIPNSSSRAMLRLVLAVHDIGKPQAVRLNNKNLQHVHTTETIEALGKFFPWKQEDLKIAKALVDGDPIGKLFQSRITFSQAENEIKEMAEKAGLPASEFLKLLCILYQSDASSYTADAGGKPSLEKIFAKDNSSSEKGFLHSEDGMRIKFGGRYEKVYQTLESRIKELEKI